MSIRKDVRNAQIYDAVVVIGIPTTRAADIYGMHCCSIRRLTLQEARRRGIGDFDTLSELRAHLGCKGYIRRCAS